MKKTPGQKEGTLRTGALVEISKQIFIQSVEFHQAFEKKVPIGYHNSTHVDSVINGASLLVLAAINDENTDPLCLRQDIDRYNKDNQANFTLQEFLYICQIVFSLHDTGNICQVDQSGEPTYFAFYTATNAETRSQSNATALLGVVPHFKSLPQEDQASILSFVNYLIGHTVYQETGLDQPFARFIKFCDQMGILLLEGEKIFHQQLGLVEEISKENPTWGPRDPEQFFNFVHYRFPVFVPDKQTRQAILDVWSVSMPPQLNQEQISFYLNRPRQL